MKRTLVFTLLTATLGPLVASAQSTSGLKQTLTFHESFDKGLNADFSRGDKACLVHGKQGIVPAALNEELKLVPDGGDSGGAAGEKAGALEFRKLKIVRP